jgi:hypothetical protein
MKRIVAIIVAIGLLATSAVAIAGIQGGDYDGTTAQNKNVTFFVTAREKVKRIGYVVRGSCQNGARYKFTNNPDPNRVNINDRGRFRETVQSSDGDAHATIRGKIRNNGTAFGTVEAHRQASPPSGRCDTPDVGWTASR